MILIWVDREIGLKMMMIKIRVGISKQFQLLIELKFTFTCWTTCIQIAFMNNGNI